MLIVFLCLTAFFHLSEFLLDWHRHRDQVSLESFLFSRNYCIVITLAIAEYAAEGAIFPALKSQGWVSAAGLVMAVAGEGIRKTAIITAQRSFTLSIATQHLPEHRLITHGIYARIRHPAYLGWFLWAVGMEVLLVNPVLLSSKFVA